MIILIEVIIRLLCIAAMFVFSIGIIFISLASSIYFIGFLYDSIIGNLVLRIGSWAVKKIPQIKNINLLVNMWKRIQPKEIYLRYETPLLTYCFSYMAIFTISLMLPGQSRMKFVYASIIYLLFYFVGMRRSCGRKEEYYAKVLKNNKDFLKLSFLPITFIITVLGFFFTITGLKLQEISVDFNQAQKIITQFIGDADNMNMVLMFMRILVVGIILVVIFYIFSLPIQVISYFIISVIQYFHENSTPYKKLFEKYIELFFK